MKEKNRCNGPLDLSCHMGVFRKKIGLFEGTALMVTGTIGAGVLGIPYAVSQIGVIPGVLYIIAVGVLMMSMNLLVGEISVRTKKQFQLAGLAKHYLGGFAEFVMSALVYIMLFGAMVVYMVGEGETLSVLFGGDPFVWSLVFFAFGAFLIFIGLRTIKTVELVVSLGIFVIVLLIAAVSVPHTELSHLLYSDLTIAKALLPYGVLLFAFHGATAVPEAHALLRENNDMFKKSIVLAGIVTVTIYTMFSIVVVGVTGTETTEIATIGLGNQVGPMMAIFGNIFAALAMGTSFIMSGLALRDSLRWDHGTPYGVATAIVCSVPLIVYLLGVRAFIATIDIIGGVFMSLEMLLLLLIYWKATQKGDLPPTKYKVHHSIFIFGVLLIALAVGAVYSVIKLF